MITLYGIPNCDTIKKAKKWLEQHNLEYTFHNYRKDGVSLDLLNQFNEQLDWQEMVNKRGTTYRQLSDETKASLSKDTALALLVEHPAMIKRPILSYSNDYFIGFKPAQYEDIFKS